MMETDLGSAVKKTVTLFNKLNSPQAVARTISVTQELVIIAFSGPFCYECGDIQKYVDGFAKDFRIFVTYAELSGGKARETTTHSVEVSYLVKKR